MRKIYFLVQFVLLSFSIFPIIAKAQDCSLLTATFTTYESRCAATGSIKVFATGGSGSYKYKTIGPVTSNFTSSDSLTGLSAGTYSVVITDIVSNCTFTQTNLIVPGSYQDPRFALIKTDVSCDGINNGNIQVNGQLYGRSPFVYSIEAPSAMGVGTTNSTGLFDNLSAGDYTIRLTDSCGGIQTRQIRVNDYNWWIDSYLFNKTDCNTATGFIKVVDSKGNISTVGGIAGFEYGIVRQPGDTIWSSSPNFIFNLAGYTNFEVIAKDNCGTIKKAPASLIIKPSLNAVVISSKSCNTFTASVSGVTNFFNPNFCLFDSSNVLLNCNTTGTFPGLTYGNYCITVHDSCTNITITRCFAVTPPPLSISNTVSITNKICNSFSAKITGQNGLTNPDYCLYNATNSLITCNTTGVFNNLAYGSYCIKMTDGCRDTTITRCFGASRPVPSVPAIIIPHFTSCTTFDISIGGDSLTNPQYCLYDSANVLVACNNTGIFSGLAFGSYCANVHDSCFDTTFIRCFIVDNPIVVNDLAVTISNKTCSTFTAKATSGLINPSYCLYDASDSLIACDSSGIFNNIQNGSYCIKAKNDCPDTTFTKCFTVAPNLPSVNDSVKIINTTCTNFTAQIFGKINLNNPSYCIYDTADVQIACNSTGQFDSLPYGSYCIKIVNNCYDTTIVRCFTANPKPVKLNVNSSKSCSYNYAKFRITVSNASTPVNIKIYAPNGSLFIDSNYNTSGITIDSIPGTMTGQTYKIIVTDDCGNKDSVSIGATASYLTHIPNPVAKCPSGTFVNGSGDIQTTAFSNMGSLTVRVIKKDNIALSPQLSPNTVVGGVYSFQDLGPGTYILNYKVNDACNIYLYDTVVIKPYQFPYLSRTSAYQCDVSGFSLEAVVSDGVGPFTYEIIGSSPATPSIIAGPQLSPVFNISNGTNYSLVRLRALDACGNATLTDASILPLANNGIVNLFNCFQIATTLTLDTVYNSTYAWYKKSDSSSTDSIYLGSAASIFIPEVLPGDTGIYVCYFVQSGGCITRTYNYHLDGSCYNPLPINLQSFTGNFVDGTSILNWKIDRKLELKTFIIERKTTNNSFIEIGRVHPNENSGNSAQYNFIDTKPLNSNFYRLKLFNKDNTFTYSNIIVINKNQPINNILLYPNPVYDVLNINFGKQQNHNYKISILTTLNQVVKEIKFAGSSSNTLQIIRTKNMSRGIYILNIVDLSNNEETTQKVIFR